MELVTAQVITVDGKNTATTVPLDPTGKAVGAQEGRQMTASCFEAKLLRVADCVFQWTYKVQSK